jgi:two-component system response regulator AtoC
MTPKILIVDDEIETCKFLGAFLEPLGYQIITALNGEEALEKIKSEEPHLMLLDIRMPEMDGIEVLEHAKTLNPRMGIIMITAVQDEDTARQAIADGAHDYITHPIDLDYLESSVMVKMTDILG